MKVLIKSIEEMKNTEGVQEKINHNGNPVLFTKDEPLKNGNGLRGIDDFLLSEEGEPSEMLDLCGKPLEVKKTSGEISQFFPYQQVVEDSFQRPWLIPAYAVKEIFEDENID